MPDASKAKCVICGREFAKRRNQKVCGEPCRQQRMRGYQQAYREANREAVRERVRESTRARRRGNRPADYMEAECVVCGRRFKARAHNQITCGEPCRLRRKLERERAYRRANGETMKAKCIVCGRWFAKRVHNQKVCGEPCRRQLDLAYRRRRYQANPDKKHESNRDWARANREKMRDWHRDWVRANPERARENQRDWYRANIEKMRERDRARRQANAKKRLEALAGRRPAVEIMPDGTAKVRGKPKDAPIKSQLKAIKILLDAFKAGLPGLTREEMDERYGNTGWRSALRTLRDLDRDWRAAILFPGQGRPGEENKYYRIDTL